MALAVAVWTGESGAWPLKLAPFSIPPFRALFMNEHGDFFAGTPDAVARHAGRRLRDGAHSARNRFHDLARGASLWLFALAAQRFAFLSRAARRHWRWNELAPTVEASSCRWILFLEGDAETPVGDMLPLFDDPRTFAVSRQIDYRDWNLGLFARAPFRPLQPGEASQTLAPLSTAILVDRSKLLALGIPKTVVPGSAWLELFWMAAAAGWRCFSVGQSHELPESSDWPYEEAEFVTRVLADPALRKLGPGRPGLSRGSIAFAPHLAQPPRGLPRVLIVSPYLPYPLSHGGAVRIYNLCKALAGRVDFLLACFREKNEPVHYDRLHEVFREVYVVDRDERALGDKRLPRQVREHQSESLRDLIGQLRFDYLQVEFAHLAEFHVPDVPSILVEHDLTFTLYRQLGEREESSRWLEFERKWLRIYSTVWTMSEPDRALAIAEGSPEDRTLVIPNGVDIERFTPQLRPEGPPEILYVGSFRHRPNLLGFDTLRREILPRVWRRCPEARLCVVAGPDHLHYWRESGNLDPRIEVHGFVEDLRPLYAKASAVAVPLEVSAGTNIKVMEAMACGRAVVSTPVGCQGLGLIDGADALIRAGWEDFAAALCDLLEDSRLRERIAAAARQTVEQRFSWKAIAERAWQCYAG
ncbi:MAG: glycosyltransferase family 4 protein [Acidobacteria bacterium]|nr:glycosyltransferase family 4 protein [Acidobacteriota bacterium]